jgi:hypothetical protein
MVPREFAHTRVGLLRVAEVAGPPSPVDDPSPVPATVDTKYDGIALTGAERSKQSTVRKFAQYDDDLFIVSEYFKQKQFVKHGIKKKNTQK